MFKPNFSIYLVYCFVISIVEFSEYWLSTYSCMLEYLLLKVISYCILF